jgi:hypothetical protein
MIIRILISIIFIPLCYFYGAELIDLIRLISLKNSVHLAFMAAFAGSTLLFLIFLGRGSFISIFEHELTHNLWAILTFRKPVGFQVFKGQGGRFYAEGKDNYMITLSPYFFLTLSFLFLPLFLVIQPSYHKAFMIILGILTGFHTSTTIKETGLRQDDLHTFGILFSLIFILLGNIISYGIILSFVTGGWEGIKEFLFSGMKDIISYGKDIVVNLVGN